LALLTTCVIDSRRFVAGSTYSWTSSQPGGCGRILSPASYSTLKTFLTSIDYERIHADHSVFVHVNGIIIAIYVDDLLLLGPDIKSIQKLKDQLNSCFRMKDLGPLAWYLGMQITRNRSKRIIWINQSTYIKQAIEDLDMVSCNPVGTPMDAGYALRKDVYLKGGVWIEYSTSKEER